jgi:hypothetical protein
MVDCSSTPDDVQDLYADEETRMTSSSSCLQAFEALEFPGMRMHLEEISCLVVVPHKKNDPPSKNPKKLVKAASGFTTGKHPMRHAL